MVLVFSTLGHLPATILEELKHFQKQSGISLQLEEIPWKSAWPTLLSFAVQAKGPHVSQIGSTWVASLEALHALRPFGMLELHNWALTGESISSSPSLAALTPASRQSVERGRNSIHALPWLAYTFVVAYRREHFRKAGLAEQEAFSSSDAFIRSLQALQKSGFDSPLSIHADPDGPHLLHILISWVWEQGQPLLRESNQLNFEPVAAACEKFFQALQQFAIKRYPVTLEEAEERFINGKASVLICGAERPYIWKKMGLAAPELLSDLGIAPIPGIPWVGGTNLGIWRYARIDAAIERQALRLVEYLMSLPVQQRIAASGILPVRQEALAHLPEQDSPLTQAIFRILQQGRSYPPTALWGRIESSFRLTFERIMKDLLENNETAAIVRFHLRSLAQQLRFLLPPKEESKVFHSLVL